MALDVRRGFHHDLDLVRDDLVRLAGMVTEALARGTEALLAGDLKVAEELINGDDVLDTLAVDIEERWPWTSAPWWPPPACARRSSAPATWSST
jgi:phosphate uptake regulator